MHVEDSNLAELLQTTLISFDPDCREFSFVRTMPVAVYVDAADNGSDLGSDLVGLVDEVLKESGFEEFETFGPYYGSFLKLNLSRSTVPLDGPTFEESLGNLRRKLINRLRQFPWKETAKSAGAAIEVAVAIGEIVLIVHAGPAVAPVIASFHISAKLWMVLTAAGHGNTAIEQIKKIVVHSKQAAAAIKKASKPGPGDYEF